MRISWIIFLSLVLIVTGVQLNLTGTIEMINLPVVIEAIALLVMVVFIVIAIWNTDPISKDLGVMSILCIGTYYFARLFKIDTILINCNILIVRIVSIIFIIAAAVLAVIAIMDRMPKTTRKPETN